MFFDLFFYHTLIIAIFCRNVQFPNILYSINCLNLSFCFSRWMNDFTPYTGIMWHIERWHVQSLYNSTLNIELFKLKDQSLFFVCFWILMFWDFSGLFRFDLSRIEISLSTMLCWAIICDSNDFKGKSNESWSQNSDFNHKFIYFSDSQRDFSRSWTSFLDLKTFKQRKRK